MTMYFKRSLVSLGYSEIASVDMERNTWKGDMIRITPKSGKAFILPFLANDLYHLNAVYAELEGRWEASVWGKASN